ncbi:MAG: hypothetical protein AVDCRST_MAG31-2065 [uncultured Sphingomonas sp.]|uniref:DUF3617 family protein n=1 Tax=uncultured Sphingomonas sp. TaxID=158754 RepID=A0A6J4TMM6_9SPHN|nr:hypothetical protein [uncultured Sphingomonas sp.]CAA9527500.1 MAG: hypothetical protein AVDCRST_MAG31-2065 [uncultured Sphingomonas sp.]
MTRMPLALSCLLFGLASAGAIAEPVPKVALGAVPGGLWEVSRSATGDGASRQCVAEPAALAQWQHRGRACTRVVLADKPGEALIHYTCPAGDFGRSRITVITPRTLRIETQGISGGEPFSYKLHARRVGNCQAH